MKFLFVLSFILLAACAKHDRQSLGQASCELQVGAVQATYPDGQTRKSNAYACSDGCYKYAWVNDNSVQFNTCDQF